MTSTPMTPSQAERADTLAVIASTETSILSPLERENLHRRVTDLYALADEVGRLRKALSDAASQVAELESDLGGATAETAALKQRIHEACMARVWTNEDGKKFVFADDLKGPLLGKAPLRGRALLDAKAAEEATATHWKRLGIDPAAGEAVAAELEAAGSRLTAVELLVEEARGKCNHTIDTDLLLDALGLEN